MPLPSYQAIARTNQLITVAPGSDCTAAFRAAYENRYTWDPGFGGYSGRCSWEQGDQRAEGSFQVGADLKAQVEGIADEAIHLGHGLAAVGGGHPPGAPQL